MNDSAQADNLTPSAASSTFGAGGAGAMLRAAREAQGVHVTALAAALKVPSRQLEALESDRLDQLPDLTFARALTASICRQLKVDPAPLLAALPQGAPHLRTDRDSLNERFEEPGEVASGGWREWLGRPPVLVALALLVAAVVLLAVPLRREAPLTSPAASAPQPAASEPAATAGQVSESVTPALPAASTPGLAVETVTPALPAASR